MSIYPEKLLTRRYALQSELWGLSEEISRLERQARPLLDELQSIATDGGARKQWRRESLHLNLQPIRERIRILNDQRLGKRKELINVEKQLRETFKAMGHSMAMQAERVVANSSQVNDGGLSQTSDVTFTYDLFVSHATEDKDDIVRPLVDSLRELGLRVWYDEVELTIGDSLRQSIDAGLANSRFGIVIISPSFLKKRWTTYELDSLVAREIESGKVILPIWHKITKDEVLQYSPKLADKVALHTATNTIADIALEIAIAVYDSSD
jgi:hypothetical protein